MNRFIVWFLFPALWLLLVKPSGASRDISKILEKERKAQGLPGVAAMVARGEKIAAQGVAGFRRIGGSDRIRINDRWHLGSCTKAITATMIGVLAERGVISWDAEIGEILPELAETAQPAYRKVTIEMLLAHRGGIRHEWDVPGLWDILWKREGTPVEERRKMAKALLSQPPKVGPGEYFYSNCGYGIAGHMAETVAGKPWERLVREIVFEPLRMKSAGFGVPWSDEPPTDPWPHKQDGTPITPGPFADNPPSIGPGATIHASLGDWAKFVAEHLKGAKGKNGRLLDADTYRRLHLGRDIGGGAEYALGWFVVRRPWAEGGWFGKGRCLNHAGSNNSWYSIVWIAPERNFAVIAATNIGGEKIFKKLDATVWAVIRDNIDEQRK